MPDIPSSQDVAVSFGGTALGNVIGFSGQYSVTSVYDATGQGATITGTAGNARITRKLDPTMVDPGRMEFRALGNASLSRSDIGRKATLLFYLDGATLSVTAFLADYRLEGTRGQLLESFYSFQFTGDN
jgi:hypothetical protein